MTESKVTKAQLISRLKQAHSICVAKDQAVLEAKAEVDRMRLALNDANARASNLKALNYELSNDRIN